VSEVLLSFGSAIEPTVQRKPVTSTLPFVLPLFVLTACLIAALLLVLAHFGSVTLPGCGSASACARAAESGWGLVPGTKWPLSFLGFAYFQALVAAYIYAGGRLPVWLRAAIAIGAIASILLTPVMFREDYLCGYCLTIHALNITFAFGYELSRWRAPADHLATAQRATPLVAFSGTFVTASLLLSITQHQSTAAATQRTESQLMQALNEGARAGKGASAHTSFGRGRYYLGPTTGRVHVVVVSDYQCPSCRTIDAQLRAMVAGRDDISISARHFPFCTDCNEHVDKTRHSNACHAALAAEAAGIVGGADAFWQMHDWLFERGGNFMDEELEAKITEMGLDKQKFLAVFRSDKTLAIVRGDADDADDAGLRFTPMVLINGKPLELGQ
jgi:protein-disulfide isomerase/uncharacterized membrane protein